MIAQSPHGHRLWPTPLLGGLSPQTSCAGTGRRSRCWCARRCPACVRRCRAARSCSRWPRATTSSRAWSCAQRRALVAAPRAVRRGARCRRSTQPGWTLLVQGVDLHVRAAHELLDALSLRARCAARRPDGLLRQRRRRRRPARRFLRRVPAAGAGPAALAHRPRRATPRCAPDVPLKILAELRARAGVAARARRHALPAAGLGARRRGRGRVHDLLDRLSRAGRDELAREVLQRLLDAAETPDGATRSIATRTQAATDRPAAFPTRLQRFAARRGGARCWPTRVRSPARSARC